MALRLGERTINWSALAFLGAATIVAVSWMSATLTTVGTVGNMLSVVRTEDVGLMPRPLRQTLPPPKKPTKFERIPEMPDAAGLDASTVRLAYDKAASAALAQRMRNNLAEFAAAARVEFAPLSAALIAAAAGLGDDDTDYTPLTGNLVAAIAHDRLAEPTDLVVPMPHLRPAPPAPVVVAVAPPVERPAAPAAPAPERRQVKPAEVAPKAVPAQPVAPRGPVIAGLPRPGSGVAVYDISAGVVYLPSGERLEAHSGIGHMRDNPLFTHVKMRGATPPAVYNLRMREALFHGVEAIRLNPVDGVPPKGRVGLLAHTYMLRVPGDSNGCVSFRDYPRFLAAFKRGEIRQMVVVNSVKTRTASIF
jgi:hypothetical protein